MKLVYYKEELNFGDALNKFIFDYYCKDEFDEDDSEIVMGIGTLLGLEKGNKNTKKIIVFSSGYGFGAPEIYGELPTINEKYDIISVRGPLTAEKLGIDKNLAITDGAVLLKGMNFPNLDKEYEWSFMPHLISEKMYPGWKKIVEKAGGHFISAMNEPDFVIKEILKTKVLITETMHGAIVADTLRTPWISVKAYKHINEFKWKDWLLTVKVNYTFTKLPSLFTATKLKENSKRKVKGLYPLLGFPLYVLMSMYQSMVKEKTCVSMLQSLSKQEPLLSSEEVLNENFNKLNDKLQFLRTNYLLK